MERHPLTRKLGIKYPIIQGALGGFDTRPLAATVSNFGGLGSFGAHVFAPEAIRSVIADIRALTSRPFAINLWVSTQDDGAFTSGPDALARSLRPLAPYIEELGLPIFKPFSDVAPAIGAWSRKRRRQGNGDENSVR